MTIQYVCAIGCLVLIGALSGTLVYVKLHPAPDDGWDLGPSRSWTDNIGNWLYFLVILDAELFVNTIRPAFLWLTFGGLLFVLFLDVLQWAVIRHYGRKFGPTQTPEEAGRMIKTALERFKNRPYVKIKSIGRSNN